jgi:carbon monoxide dehydrogenase subunit G
MPEVRYQRPVNASVEEVWAFVKDMNNWAPMMTGYQSHEIKTERESVWTLRGDVGILSRVVEMAITITEWSGPSRVSFSLEGINEMVSGDGTFEIIPRTVGSETPAPMDVKRSLFARLIRWFFRTLFQKKYGRIEAPVQATTTARAELIFTWRMEAGGPTAPLVNAMLGPAIEPAAEHLAEQIAQHVEKASLG